MTQLKKEIEGERSLQAFNILYGVRKKTRCPPSCREDRVRGCDEVEWVAAAVWLDAWASDDYGTVRGAVTGGPRDRPSAYQTSYCLLYTPESLDHNFTVLFILFIKWISSELFPVFLKNVYLSTNDYAKSKELEYSFFFSVLVSQVSSGRHAHMEAVSPSVARFTACD